MVIFIIIILIALPFVFKISYIQLIKAIPLIVKDIYMYFKNKEWRNFKEFGLDLYVGSFGRGKTMQAVNRVYNLHKRYPDIAIYSNIRLNGIEYIPLTNFQQIVDIEDKAIVLIDECGVMFNNRNFGNFPIALLDNILQCRHLGLYFVLTAQKYEDVDLILRKNISNVYECHKLFNRLFRTSVYDGYRVYYSKVDYHNLKPDKYNYYLAFNDKMRSRYDTTEIATNITNVIDDDKYVAVHTREDSAYISKYKKRYNEKKYSK